MYPLLSAIFVVTILFGLLLISGFLFKPRIWRNNTRTIKILCAAWFIPYLIFILFFTGPEDLSEYPARETSPYKLPWEAGVSRFVAQGNRSFTSHRDLHLCAWDFAMGVGTPVLASREGVVIHVEVNHDGFQPLANYIVIEHVDGDQTGYAHLKNDGSLVKVGDHVNQGQPIGYSGRVGIAPFPHLHFYATSQSGSVPKPISFQEVPNGVPFAGRFYSSENGIR
jgi:murein DD-endopeptidase MepM/ murein hydrolase activator NlpD